jgi:spore germination protein
MDTLPLPDSGQDGHSASRRAVLCAFPAIALAGSASCAHSPGSSVVVPPRPKIAAYVSGAAGSKGMASFREHAALIDELSLSLWRPADAADGRLSVQGPGTMAENRAFVGEARNAGSSVWGVTANYHGRGTWRWDIVTRILNDPSVRTAHVRHLVELALQKEYVGIEVDYENAVRRADREPFTRFCYELSHALTAAGKRLSVTVHPKSSEPGKEARQVIQDWRAIGAVAHEVRIMMYDYSPDRGQASQSPLPWWERQAEFAVSQVSADKIMMGAPSYGYHWAGAQTPVEDLEWRSIEALRRRERADRVRDPSTGSLHVTYRSGARRHDIWYEDARGLAERARIVRAYGMRGLFVWRLGGEDPRTWAAVRTELDRDRN